jgi:hypothetical protein
MRERKWQSKMEQEVIKSIDRKQTLTSRVRLGERAKERGKEVKWIWIEEEQDREM